MAIAITAKMRHIRRTIRGGMNILLNREPSPIEVYNDLNGKIVNLFKVLREKPLEFLSLIYLTPYSREEYNTCHDKEYTSNKDSDVERARRTLVLISQSIMARGLRGSKAGWGYTITASHSNQALRWNNIIARLLPAINRIKNVQIENLPALEIIRRYDTKDTLFYCDPPYVLSTRRGKDYEFEMTDEEHIELSETLHRVKGKVALSGYDCELYRDLYSDWECIKDKPRPCPSSKKSKKPLRQECLWVNYDTKEQKPS